MTRAVWVWGPPGLVMLLIFGLSSTPDLPAPPGGLSDVGAHALAYGVLAVFMLRALADTRWDGVTIRTTLAAFCLTLLYGLTDEFHQWFVPGRVSEWRDVFADAVGAVLGTGAVWVWSIVFSSWQNPR